MLVVLARALVLGAGGARAPPLAAGSAPDG